MFISKRQLSSERQPVHVVPIQTMTFYQKNKDLYYLDRAYRLGNELGSKVDVKNGVTFKRAIDQAMVSSDKNQKHLLEFGNIVVRYRDTIGCVDASVSSAIMADKAVKENFQAGVADGLADKFAWRNIDPRTGKKMQQIKGK